MNPNPPNPTNPADGTFVVVQGGQRVTGALSQTEAQAEAERRNRLHEESKGTQTRIQPAQVKQNLMG